MNSRSVVLPPSLPRVARVPRAVESDGADACFLASNYGLTPDPWQEDVLEAWLGRRKDGRWSSATCGLAVPRQNGKNALIEVRELFGMVALGEKFLHTAHQVKTARKAFKRILSFFENERQYPELAALVQEIRRTNSQEAIVLKNGGSVEFVARTRSSGRGFTVDVLVCDEAQDLDDDALEALQPTISAAPLGNPQVIFTGTPPNPELNQTGEVFIRVRNNGDTGRDARLCWHDFGVEDGPCPDVDDRNLWLRTNPALGSRLGVSEVEGEHMLMSPEGFARERLGWWGQPGSVETFFGVGRWPSLADANADVDERYVFGLDTTPERSWTSIGVAGYYGNKVFVDIGIHDQGTRWVVDECTKLHRLHPAAVFAIDKIGPAASLIPELEAAGIPLAQLSTVDCKKACGWFFDRVQQDGVAHLNNQDLNSAVAGAKKRDVGDAWLYDRKRSAVISPLVAVTWAAWALTLDPGPLDDVGVWTF